MAHNTSRNSIVIETSLFAHPCKMRTWKFQPWVINLVPREPDEIVCSSISELWYFCRKNERIKWRYKTAADSKPSSMLVHCFFIFSRSCSNGCELKHVFTVTKGVSIRVGIIKVTWAWGHDLRFKYLNHPVHGGSILWARRNTLGGNWKQGIKAFYLHPLAVRISNFSWSILRD